MIKFFRSIRQNLLAEGKTGKYLKYAIGEIILVVIGILIALQINTWNENRKEATLARQYLIGIRDNLNKDTVLLDSLILTYANDISLINSVEKIFDQPVYMPEKYRRFFIKPDTSRTKYLFYRGISFRPIRATYNSLLADGKSSLIKNKDLFETIQEIYDERHERINSVYETFKPSEDRIHWTYPYEKKSWGYADLLASREERIFLDLVNFTEIKYFYSQHLQDLQDKMQETITLIDRELNP